MNTELSIATTQAEVLLRAMPEAPATPHKSWNPEWDRNVLRIAEGDETALAALYDASSSLVYALAVRILRHRADAEEVTQDVYLQVWRTARTFDPARGRAGAWIVTLARSRALDRLRARQRRPDSAENADELAASWLPARREEPQTSFDQEPVRAALDALPREQRHLIELAFYEGLTHSEMAARLGLPLGTIKSRIRAGLGKLRESLERAGLGGQIQNAGFGVLQRREQENFTAETREADPALIGITTGSNTEEP